MNPAMVDFLMANTHPMHFKHDEKGDVYLYLTIKSLKAQGAIRAAGYRVVGVGGGEFYVYAKEAA